MKYTIDVKHVRPNAHVRHLIEELITRLEEKLQHFPQETVSLHVLCEENGTRKVSRVLLTCHIPGHTVAAHEEGREAGAAIRDAFDEIERQLAKHSARMRGEHVRKRAPSRLQREAIVEPDAL